MNTHADKTQENKSQSVSNETSQKQGGGESTFQFVDNRPEAVEQLKLQEMANSSPQVSQLKAFQVMVNNSPQAKQVTQLQAMADNHSAQRYQPIQMNENNTGLPDNLKTGMENLSGMSLDDVKVHKNSDKPAQLQAHAYAQGTEIHLGPGQEKHLSHEAWHVVQQKQGRVKPTMQMKGKVNVNDDAGLEKEADVMGAKALQTKTDQSQIKKAKTQFSNVKQLMPMAREVYGITHLVKMVDGHIYAENYESNEEQEVSEGDLVTIESDSKIFSRRGPNQEVEKNNTEDKEKVGNYAWYLVTNLNGIDQSGKELYIREDTIRIAPNKKNKSSKLKTSGEILSDVGGNINTGVDLGLGLTNYGDHGGSGSGYIDAFGGNNQSIFSGDSSFGGKQNNSALTSVEYNSGWADPRTAGLGMGLGAIGGALALKGAASGLNQARKDFRDGDVVGKAEAVGSGVENLASMASTGVNLANSAHNLQGAITGNTATLAGMNGYTLGGQAVPVASTVMGGIGMVKNTYQIGKNKGMSHNLNDMANSENVSVEAQKVASYGAKTADKRANRAGVNLASNTLSTASGAASLTGFGVGVGAALGTASSGVKFGAMGARLLKQKMRDNRAKKGEKESYATWKARQKEKISNTNNPVEKAKYKMLIKTTMNWDKTTANKDAERADMAQSLVNLAKNGGVNLVDAAEILFNIGGNKTQIKRLRTLDETGAGKTDDAGLKEEAEKLKTEIEALFQKRE
jgi:hypothetical protein